MVEGAVGRGKEVNPMITRVAERQRKRGAGGRRGWKNGGVGEFWEVARGGSRLYGRELVYATKVLSIGA